METPASLTHIGKYEIVAELGRGGMGVVYRAEDKNIGREVAIKTLTDVTPELRQRFLVEARSGVLNHQNIVTVYDFGEQDGSPYIVMEYLQGESLEKALRGTLSLVDKLEIVRQVCDGLAYAHLKGVVHRDIKPANVMVQPGGRIKIVDFGIARLESSSGHTQTGAVIGTFHYISPERLKGHPSDGRADIWAAGIMLYQMITGVLPFPGEDISALHKVVNEPYPPLSNYLSNYPAGLDQVLDRALAKDPDERYSSAEEMASDLESITEVMKRARVGEMLLQIQALLEEDKLTSARPMLLDLQRLDPQNFEIKKMLRDVQDRLARQQKHEQVRQTLNLAEEAVLSQRYVEALELYKQAGRIDASTPGLTEKIEHVRGLKEKVDKISVLHDRARAARERRDLHAASEAIEEALRLDERNTDLRNERAGILREIERQSQESTRRRLKDAGRGHMGGRAYTEAIKDLREALNIDPTDVEVQTMLQEATSRQEEERRRKVIEQIVGEIQDSLFRNETERALQLINRALDRLPAEASLLRLKADTERRLGEEHAQKLVQETSLRVQELFSSNPQEALSCVQQALTQMPGEERLMALQERVVEQLKRANLEGLRAQYLKHAQASLAAKQYDQAISALESAALDCGESPEITYLLERARTQKKDDERALASTAILEAAQRRLAEEDLEGALEILKPAAQDVGGAAIGQLLRQTQERLDEVSRRLEAVVTRVGTLGETDPAQALQLLAAQPASVQQHSRLRALRAKLEIAAEQQNVTRQAIAQATELLGKRELRGGLDALEAVRSAYGDSPAIAAAIADYKQRQAPVASEMVGESVSKARHALLAKKGTLALEELQRSADVLDLADANCRADWNRLAQEAAQLAKIKVGATGTVPIIVQRKGASTGLISGIAAAVLLAVGGILFFTLHGRPPAGGPVPANGFLQLNAAPFAEVVSVTGPDGKAAVLPAGSHVTPLRVDNLQAGNYVVLFKAVDGSQQKQTCDSAAEQPCSAPTAAMSDSQIDEILAGPK